MNKIKQIIIVALMVQTAQGNFMARLTKLRNILPYIYAAKKTGKVWWVTDIDETLVKVLPKQYKPMEKDTVNTFIQAQKEVKITGLTSTDQHYIFALLILLKKQGITFPGFSHAAIPTPLNPPVHFNEKVAIHTLLYGDVIFTNMSKGQALIDYLKMYEDQGKTLPDTIIFSDDKKSNIENVFKEVPKVFTDITIIGLDYFPENNDE